MAVLDPECGIRPLETAEWQGAWLEVRDRYEQAVEQMAVGGESVLRRELIFCLLGGHGVSFELALSATDVVMALAPFSAHWTSDQLRQRLARELATAQFDPRRRDGNLRRYRFPNRKSRLIAAARGWLLQQGTLAPRLTAIDRERERRTWLCSCPGLGPKSASWLLRNVGAAHGLAVLDVHILRAMAQAGRLPSANLPRDYELVERAFLGWCEELDASPGAFDLFLWEWQRTANPSVRA